MTQLSEFDQKKQQQLSQKRIWISTLLGFLIAIAPYFYTQRWKPLLWFVGIIMGVSFLIETVAPSDSFKNSFQRGQNWSPLVTLVAITDNWLAITRSRKRLQEDGDIDSES